MEDHCATCDAQNDADVPSRLSGRRPLEALELAGRQPYSTYKAFTHGPATRMGVEAHRHELEHSQVLLDVSPERKAVVVPGERDGGHLLSTIVDRNGEPAADAEAGGVIEKALLAL